ncbi:MAG: hypothetical protein H6815_06160 [Phycisphaeraceae bacterium]|nr:hypothetical protein [Phycisphaerales bacterium]MCB9860022.1 hypothetical protein [Phycisphaeraceae bacterium]
MARRGWQHFFGTVAASLILAHAAWAQPGSQPDVLSAVQRLLDAPYNTDEDRARIRTHHGVWTVEDLAAAHRLSFAALTVGDYERVLRVNEAGIRGANDLLQIRLDKAEAMLGLGKYADLLAHLDLVDDQLAKADVKTVYAHVLRSAWIRASALELLGDMGSCQKIVADTRMRISENELKTSEELVYFARMNQIAARVLSVGQAGGANYDAIMRTLARARTGAGATYWPAMLAEAEVLIEKDNDAEAQKALREVLQLNDKCARAVSIVGRLSVRGFNFEQAEAMAEHLDTLLAEFDTLLADDESVQVHSIDGQAILALGALRRNDAAAVQDAASEILRRAPDHVEGLSLAAAAEAERYDFASAREMLDALDAHCSELAGVKAKPMRGYMIVGAATSENRQYADAATFLREAANRSPFDAEPVVELGLLEVQSGRDANAIQALQTATTLDPFNIRAKNSLKLLQQLQTHAVSESEHFRIRYDPASAASEMVAREMLPVLERIHARVCGDEPGGIDYEPTGKTLIELLPDHAMFAVRIAGMPKLHTFAASTGPVIAMEAPRAGAGSSMGTYDWPRVIQHEYTHTVTLARTNNRIPHWFTEAAAVYLEDAPRDYDRVQLLTRALTGNTLFTLDEISLKFVRPESPLDRPLAYAQGHWMYEFIVERFGDVAPRKLMDQYAAGLNEASAFEAVLHMPRDVFFEQFKSWAHNEVIEWGMLPEVGTPTLDELIDTLGPDEAAHAKTDPRLISPASVDAWLEKYPNHPQVMRVALEHAFVRTEKAGTDPLDDPQTRAMLEIYSSLRPVDAMPHQKLAAYWLAREDRTRALPHLEFLDVREQHSPAYAVERTKLYVEAGRWGDATVAIQRAVNIAPFDAEIRELASRVALQQRDLETAAHHIEALTFIEPDRGVHQKRLTRIREMIAEQK